MMKRRGIETKTSLALLAVIGTDKPGIIAQVTDFLFRYRANLEDISMSVLEGELGMFLMVCLPAGRFLTIQKALRKYETEWGLNFFWKKLEARRSRNPKKYPPADKFIVAAMGWDQTGIVYRISRLLAGFNLNITDLNSQILSYGRKPVYSLVLEVDIPRRFSIRKLEAGLSGLRRSLHLDITLKRVENVAF